MNLIHQHSDESGKAASVLEKCDQAFRQSLPESFKDDSAASDALRYCLRHPGSLMRAQLAYQTSVTVGLAEEDALSLATGIEYLHTASLLFDDLPCMDDALERRGFPTVHAIYGKDSAMLAALGLINRGYSLIWSAMQTQEESVRREAAAYLDECLGMTGILGGQSKDVNISANADSKEIIRVAYGKTVTLVKLTLAFPAILGKLANAEDVRELERLSIYWGLAYQVSDDLKDVCGLVKDTGKSVRQDAIKGRPNIAVCDGLPKAVSRMLHYVSKGDSVLDRLVARQPSWQFLAVMRTRFDQDLSEWTASEVENTLISASA